MALTPRHEFLAAVVERPAPPYPSTIFGDNLDADIEGAHGVGARNVWVKRDYDWLTFESRAEPG